jgi:hypothetical protein
MIFSAVTERFSRRPEHVMFVASASCEFGPVKILEDFYRECPADSSAVPKSAACYGALVGGRNFLGQLSMAAQPG